VLVKSWPMSDVNDLNNWVLTDGFLLDSTNAQVACASNHPKGTLTGFQVFLNTSFNGTEQQFAASTAPICVEQANCLKGPALVGFHSDNPLPFVDLASTPPSPNGDHAIALTRDGTAVPLASDDLKTILTPQLFPLNTRGLEAGTPFIDAAGHLSGLHPANAGSSPSLNTISSLITTKIPSVPSPLPENAVNTNWNKGVGDYYTKNYTAAQTDFHSVVAANPNFQGASDFANFAALGAANNPSATSTPNSQQNTTGLVLPGTSIPLDPWVLSVLALVVLAVLFLIVSLIMRPRIEERHRAFKAAIADADHRAELVVQQFKVMEATQRDWIGNRRTSELHSVPAQQQGSQDRTVMHKTVVEFDAADIRADINAKQLTEPEGG
jgi:hypothetical protein